MKRYTQLSFEERAMIAHYLNNGRSLREISRLLGRSASSIQREVRRNSNQSSYVPETADKRSQARRLRSCLLASDLDLQRFVVARLQEGISPELIALRLKLFGQLEGVRYINHESIYRWLYQPAQKQLKLHKLLRQSKGKRGRKRRVTRGSQIKNRTPIALRPEQAQNREEIGHFEVDLMAFLRNSQHMLVIHERATRFTAALKLANKTAGETLSALIKFFKELPKGLVKSITFDNGNEFARHMELSELLNVTTYFCDVYASWQKGGIENMNGRLRRDLPRSTNIKALSEKDLEQITINHNLTPRKCLGGLSPIEALAKHLGKPIIYSFNQGVALRG